MMKYLRSLFCCALIVLVSVTGVAADEGGLRHEEGNDRETNNLYDHQPHTVMNISSVDMEEGNDLDATIEDLESAEGKEPAVFYGRVWYDDNADSKINEGEEGAQGVKVWLYQYRKTSAGEKTFVKLTSRSVKSNGSFEIPLKTIAKNSQYYLKFIPSDKMAGYEFAPIVRGGDNGVTKKRGNSKRQTVKYGERYEVNAGLVAKLKKDAAVFYGRVWLDDNANSKIDVGEEGAVEVNVWLYRYYTTSAGKKASVKVKSRSVKSDGSFEIPLKTIAQNSQYYLKFLPSDNVASYEFAPIVVKGGDNCVTKKRGNSKRQTVKYGERYEVNAGLVAKAKKDTHPDPPGVILVHTFDDLNNDGIQEAGESDLENVEVEVTDSKGTVYTGTTDSNGDYSQELHPGMATIHVLVDSVLQHEWTALVPSGGIVNVSPFPLSGHAHNNKCDPNKSFMIFAGHDIASSIMKGEMNVTWSPAFVFQITEERFLWCGNYIYDIFVEDGTAFMNATADVYGEELMHLADEWPDVSKYETQNTSLIVKDLSPGRTYSVLVTARTEIGHYSLNRLPAVVEMATINPEYKKGLEPHVVNLPEPDEAFSVAFDSNQATFRRTGGEIPNAVTDLKLDDFVYMISSNGNHTFGQVSTKLQITPDRVSFEYMPRDFSDLFDNLDASADIANTQDLGEDDDDVTIQFDDDLDEEANKLCVELDPHVKRHFCMVAYPGREEFDCFEGCGVAKSGRRLGIKKGLKNAIKRALRAARAALKKLAAFAGNAAKFLGNLLVGKLDLDRSMTFLDIERGATLSQDIENVDIGVRFALSAGARIKIYINIPSFETRASLQFRGGIHAQAYLFLGSTSTAITLQPANALEIFTKRFSYTFVIGVVPVWITHGPSLSAFAELAVVIESQVYANFEAGYDYAIEFSFDINRIPKFDVSQSFTEQIIRDVNFNQRFNALAKTGVVFSWNVAFYSIFQGALAAEAGFRAELEVGSNPDLALLTAPHYHMYTLDTFDLAFFIDVRASVAVKVDISSIVKELTAALQLPADELFKANFKLPSIPNFAELPPGVLDKGVAIVKAVEDLLKNAKGVLGDVVGITLRNPTLATMTKELRRISTSVDILVGSLPDAFDDAASTALDKLPLLGDIGISINDLVLRIDFGTILNQSIQQVGGQSPSTEVTPVLDQIEIGVSAAFSDLTDALGQAILMMLSYFDTFDNVRNLVEQLGGSLKDVVYDAVVSVLGKTFDSVDIAVATVLQVTGLQEALNQIVDRIVDGINSKAFKGIGKVIGTVLDGLEDIVDGPVSVLFSALSEAIKLWREILDIQEEESVPYCAVGRASVQCCTERLEPVDSWLNALLDCNNDPKCTYGTLKGGLSESHKAARLHSKDVTSDLLKKFETISNELDIPVAVLFAISSRESAMGTYLGAKAGCPDGWGDRDGGCSGFGLMQVDKKSHNIMGISDPFSIKHIRQAAEIFADYRNKIAKDHPTWDKKYVLKGAAVAYNSGAGNVKTIASMDVGTAGNDYGSDVMARAQWFFLNAFVGSGMVIGASSDFVITDCGPDSVKVRGKETGKLDTGDLLVYTGVASTICSSCTPLFRKITSVRDGSTADSKIYYTTFATVAEIYGSEFYDSSIADVELEPLFRCPHSGRKLQVRGDSVVEDGFDSSTIRRMVQSSPSTCSDWQTKTSDGRCTYTDCFVGTTGDPVDCFYCKAACDNGCGESGSSLNPPDSFIAFDFAEACCIHDFCYSSKFGKDECDFDFLLNMLAACPAKPGALSALFPLRSLVCIDVAILYYFGVIIFGDGAHSNATKQQAWYELTPTCLTSATTATRSSACITRGGQSGECLSVADCAAAGMTSVPWKDASDPTPNCRALPNNIQCCVTDTEPSACITRGGQRGECLNVADCAAAGKASVPWKDASDPNPNCRALPNNIQCCVADAEPPACTSRAGQSGECLSAVDCVAAGKTSVTWQEGGGITVEQLRQEMPHVLGEVLKTVVGQSTLSTYHDYIDVNGLELSIDLRRLLDDLFVKDMRDRLQSIAGDIVATLDEFQNGVNQIVDIGDRLSFAVEDFSDFLELATGLRDTWTGIRGVLKDEAGAISLLSASKEFDLFSASFPLYKLPEMSLSPRERLVCRDDNLVALEVKPTIRGAVADIEWFADFDGMPSREDSPWILNKISGSDSAVITLPMPRSAAARNELETYELPAGSSVYLLAKPAFLSWLPFTMFVQDKLQTLFDNARKNLDHGLCGSVGGLATATCCGVDVDDLFENQSLSWNECCFNKECEKLYVETGIAPFSTCSQQYGLCEAPLLRTFKGIVFEDKSGHGFQDHTGTSAGIANVNVAITDSTGTSQVVITDEYGEYRAFVPVGVIVTDIVEDTLPCSAEQTVGKDPSCVFVPIEGEGTDSDGFHFPGCL